MTLAERANPGAFVRLLDWTPPAAGAEVMGTGIVSVALSLDGSETLSRILLVIAGLTWLALAAIIPLRAWRFRERVRAEVRTPAALTSVAGAAVLGVRLAMLGWTCGTDWLLVIAVVPFVLGLAFYVFAIARFDLRQLTAGHGDTG